MEDNARLQADRPATPEQGSDDDVGDEGNDAAGNKGETTIDANLVRELNEQALAISESLTHLLGGLRVQLLAISNITLKSSEAYALGVEHVGKTVDKCIEDAVTLITRSDELNASMTPIHALAAQVREIKRTLDILEAACK